MEKVNALVDEILAEAEADPKRKHYLYSDTAHAARLLGIVVEYAPGKYRPPSPFDIAARAGYDFYRSL